MAPSRAESLTRERHRVLPLSLELPQNVKILVVCLHHDVTFALTLVFGFQRAKFAVSLARYVDFLPSFCAK